MKRKFAPLMLLGVVASVSLVQTAFGAPQPDARRSIDMIDENRIGTLRSAIWSDLQLNAIIGNGNWSASLWYNAGSSGQKNLHIQKLSCHSGQKSFHCTFVLFRDGGQVQVLGEKAPDRLNCNADFVPDPETTETWQVRHLPPSPRGGHSKTSMACD